MVEAALIEEVEGAAGSPEIIRKRFACGRGLHETLFI